MEKKHPVGDLMNDAMQKIREMVDVNTVVGTPIEVQGVTLIPISKVSVGLASGGSEFATKQQKPEKDNAFGGGGAASVKITPMSFLVVRGDSVRLLPVDPPASGTVDRVVEMMPEIMDKVSGLMDKKAAAKKAAEEETL